GGRQRALRRQNDGIESRPRTGLISAGAPRLSSLGCPVGGWVQPSAAADPARLSLSGSSSPTKAGWAPERERWTDRRGRRPPPTKKEANNEHNYDERRYADLLQGLGHRTAGGVQPRLACVWRIADS